ncbi:dihydrodipicolinate synthase family protein [Cellulomonas palmilytica]|uniref:dihydrodipicolinate synthase family protein n=1 Tax=Cellulomonas palmilytica TaxID=2608402 RepID=UPI001F42C467|nr:dihydrodipicolinate synthase family protein [Cellulomonas palmilytica]UJP40747.1 dihydrodipicolinate synthase family protein [Cellulomonas palmilytica]
MKVGRADGVVPGLGNVDAAAYVRLWDLAGEGRWDEVREVQDRIAALFEIVFQPQGRSGDAAGVGAFKAACEEQGLIATRTTAFPVRPLDDETAAKVAAIVRESGLVRV